MSQIRRQAPDRFVWALLLSAAFAAFLVVDQVHWWQLRSDYAFGWLVPALVVFVVVERWPKLVALFQASGSGPLSPWAKAALNVVAGAIFVGGLAIFLLGAVYRAGAGSTQPGSLALAIGFSGILLGLVYFNVPEGRVGQEEVHGFNAMRRDTRLRAVALFLFPALIWMLSAPLVTAVENAVSLFLLRKVVAVVSVIFGVLGYPLIQEGNVLVLPHGKVGVADACSGIRSLTGCLFAGSFLGAIFLERFWQKAILVFASLVLAFFTNLLRSLFLTGWAYAYGSTAIEGKVHDTTGWIVLGLTCTGLFCLIPLLRPSTWSRLIKVAVPEASS